MAKRTRAIASHAESFLVLRSKSLSESLNIEVSDTSVTNCDQCGKNSIGVNGGSRRRLVSQFLEHFRDVALPVLVIGLQQALGGRHPRRSNLVEFLQEAGFIIAGD